MTKHQKYKEVISDSNCSSTIDDYYNQPRGGADVSWSMTEDTSE